jgi:hypothetical protein
VTHFNNPSGGHVSAVLNSNTETAGIKPQGNVIEIREGDWRSYLEHIARYETNPEIIARFGSPLDYKRLCALAYLGRRAQLHGGVCSITHPHVMTQDMIMQLEADNRAQRYGRYPWLETWMNILAEIERIQDEVSNGDNVISFVPPTAK